MISLLENAHGVPPDLLGKLKASDIELRALPDIPLGSSGITRYSCLLSFCWSSVSARTHLALKEVDTIGLDVLDT